MEYQKINNRQIKRIGAWAGIIAPILFAALVAVESHLRPEYSQITNNVSDLGVGPYAIIQNINFITFGILSILFALSLNFSLPQAKGKTKRRGVWCVIIFGVGLMFAGITLLFSGIVPEGYVVGTHTLASFIGFFTIIAAQLLIWRSLRDSNHSTLTRFGTYSLASGLASLVLLVVFILTSDSSYHGATERVFIAVPWLWILLTGFKLRSV